MVMYVILCNFIYLYLMGASGIYVLLSTCTTNYCTVPGVPVYRSIAACLSLSDVV